MKGAKDFEQHAAYIRDNPVRARLAERASEYPYGSAAASVEIDPVPPGQKPRSLICERFAGLKSGASTEVEE